MFGLRSPKSWRRSDDPFPGVTGFRERAGAADTAAELAPGIAFFADIPPREYAVGDSLEGADSIEHVRFVVDPGQEHRDGGWVEKSIRARGACMAVYSTPSIFATAVAYSGGGGETIRVVAQVSLPCHVDHGKPELQKGRVGRFHHAVSGHVQEEAPVPAERVGWAQHRHVDSVLNLPLRIAWDQLEERNHGVSRVGRNHGAVEGPVQAR